MNFLVFIIFGGIAGWITSVIMKTNDRQHMLGDILLGVLGAVVGGWLFNFFGGVGVTGFNLYSLLVAVIGSIVVIWIVRTIKHA